LHLSIAAEIYSAFRERLVSLRRTGRTSADVVTGCDERSLPCAMHYGVSPRPFLSRRTRRTIVGVATRRGDLSRPGVYVYFFRLGSVMFGFFLLVLVLSQSRFFLDNMLHLTI